MEAEPEAVATASVHVATEVKGVAAQAGNMEEAMVVVRAVETMELVGESTVALVMAAVAGKARERVAEPMVMEEGTVVAAAMALEVWVKGVEVLMAEVAREVEVTGEEAMVAAVKEAEVGAKRAEVLPVEVARVTVAWVVVASAEVAWAKAKRAEAVWAEVVWAAVEQAAVERAVVMWVAVVWEEVALAMGMWAEEGMAAEVVWEEVAWVEVALVMGTWAEEGMAAEAREVADVVVGVGMVTAVDLEAC